VLAENERPVVARHRVGERHGLAGHIPRGDRQRDRVAVDGGKHSFAQLALDSGFDQRQVVVHDARLVSAAITLDP
jgi:hypothetical protein